MIFERTNVHERHEKTRTKAKNRHQFLVMYRFSPTPWFDTFPVRPECLAQQGVSRGANRKHSPRTDLIGTFLGFNFVSFVDKKGFSI